MKLSVGDKHNKLMIMEDLGTLGKSYRHYYKVKCDCGKEKKMRSDAFPKVISCGCYRTELSIINSKVNIKKAQEAVRLPKGEASFNSLLSSYKMGANERDYSFELTKEEFRKLTKQDCYFCGDKPSKEYGDIHGYNGSYIYNGVDRLDNSLGYSIDNCVTSCTVCNLMKRTLGEQEFYMHIQKILDRHNI